VGKGGEKIADWRREVLISEQGGQPGQGIPRRGIWLRERMGRPGQRKKHTKKKIAGKVLKRLGAGKDR